MKTLCNRVIFPLLYPLWEKVLAAADCEITASVLRSHPNKQPKHHFSPKAES